MGKPIWCHILCLFVGIATIYINVNSQHILEPECQLDFCNGTSTSTHIKDFCSKEINMTLNGRCCFEGNQTLKTVGLDLSNCGLDTLHHILTNFTTLQFLDLTDNPMKNCSKDYFHGLINLEDLYMPENCTCPGNSTAWEENYDKCHHCVNERNLCDYLNVSCTDSGQCLHVGPGSAECVCLPHYYGYKCLRQGNFPYAVFASCMIVSTAMLSSLLWYLVGRHAKRY